MAKMYAGKNNVIPVRNIASQHWGDIIGEIDNQEDLKAALDSKVDKTHSPNALYGTDSNGNQTTYDTSSLFSTESCPEGYTEVEYISSTEPTPWIDEVSSSITVRINSLASVKGKMDQASSMFEVYMCKMKAVMTSTSDTWNVYMYDSEENEYLFNEGVSTSSITSMYGLAISWNSWAEGSYFTGIREGEGGQYIDTGIQINNYPDGRCGWDSTKSVKTDPTLYPSISEDKYATYLTYCRQMSNYYQTTITKIKAYVSESGTQSGGCVEIYPDEEEYETNTPYGYFYDYNNLHNSTGIYVSAWTRLVQGDTLYFWGEEPTTETVGYETSVKANQSFINAPNNTYIGLNILGSMEQSNWAGCAILAAVGDGVGYKHYDLYVGSSISFAYKTGVWNNISLHPGLFTCNGESYVPTIESKKIRTVPGANIILFGISRGRGYPNNTSGCSMKKTKIYKNGNVVFCGIPCIQDSTGIAGMYDTVSDTFFPSAKEGVEFIAGPVAGAKKISLGVENPSSILGLGLDNSLQAYKGKKGIELNAIMETEDYEELEYLESTDGNAAINTGITFESESWRAWEVTYALGKTSAGLNSGNINYCQYIMGDGSFGDIGQNYYRTTVGFFDGRARFNYSSSTNRCNFIYDYVREDLNRFHTLTYTNKKLYVDGKLTATIDPAQVLVTHSKPMHLFCSVGIYNSSFEGGFIGKISRCRYYYNANSDGYLQNNRVIMNDLVPVRRKSDGELGFFDKITGRFCPNINTDGVLVAGPVKTSTIELKYDIDEFVRNIAIDNQSSMIISNTVNSQGYQTSIDVNSTESTVVGYNSFITNDSDYVTLVGSAGARGNYSVAMGYGSETGANSVAIGYYANRASATTYGQQQSVTIGANARTLDYSVAIGYQAQVLNGLSVAIGHNTIVQGQYSVGIGIDNVSDNSRKVGPSSVVIGYNAMGNTAADVVIIGRNASVNNCQQAVVIGSYAQSVGSYGVSIGKNAAVYGLSGIALGYKTGAQEEAIAIGAPTMGDSNYTIAQQGSVVIGSRARTNVGGTYSVVIGYNSQNNGYQYSTVIGQQSRATGGSAVAVGSNTEAGEFSTALGYNATANSGSSIAIGKQGVASGTSGIAIGNSASSTGASSTAIGPNASAEGHSSIAIGNETHAVWDSSFAIGHGAEAGNGYYALAIGNQAKAYGQYATQISEGTNNYPNTLQFRTYRLVDSDGYIPSERLAGSAQDGYVLSYNGATGRMSWVEQSGGGGGYVLPIASDTTLGGIKVGDGLQINSSTGVLSVTGGGTGGGDGIWGQIEGDINDQTDLKNILDSKFEQTQTMPNASMEYNNKVLQYIGISDLLYKHGYVYECQYRKVSQITGSTSDESRFNVTFDVRRFEEYCKTYADFVPSEGNYVCDFDEGDNNWHLAKNGYEFFQISKNNLQYCGIYVNYYGANEPQTDDAVYMNYIKSTNVEAPFGYVWNQLNVQDNANVVDNVTSTSTTDALSARQGKLLNDKIETLESIGQFLAIWDCNKNGHNARYLDNGYQYQRGNYFIIGAVEEWNMDPEEGPVTVSFDTNNHVAISGGYTTTEDELKLYNRYKPTTDATFKFTWNVSSQKWYDETKHTYLDAGSLLSTIGFCPSHNAKEVQAADLVEGDYFEVIYTHTHNYFPVGDTYYEAPDAGCVRTYEDVKVSDMIFYDGSNWVLLANHSKQTAVDHDLDTASKNPVENATVTNALNNKVSTTSNGNRVYGTTALGEQIALEIGDGFVNENGVLSVDISGKQDTLVSGENIKTINGESILGSGDLVIQGGGGEGMGTLNISNVFHRLHGVIKEEDVADSREDRYKGGVRDILFTTNADVDYLKANKEDIYVTYSRRNARGNLRKYRVLNDYRVKSDVKLYCWRYKTYRYWDSTFNTMRNNDGDWDNYASDLNYEYFYTLSDYSDDVEAMYNDSPVMYISDLRRQGSQKDEDNYSMGNWGTCLNELYNFGNVTNYYDDYTEAIKNGRLERCAKYDIDELVVDGPDMKHDEKGDTDFIIKMVGQSFTKNGQKYYFWSHEWWNEGSIYACLDGNDEPIPNYVPEDKSQIVYFCEFADLESEGYELVEKRPDLVWWKFNESKTENNLKRFIENCRNITTSSTRDGHDFTYWFDGGSITDLGCGDEGSFIERISDRDGDYTLTYNSGKGGWYFNYDSTWYSPTDLGDNYFKILDGEFSYHINTDGGYAKVDDGTVIHIYYKNRKDQCHRVYFWDYPIQPVRLSQCKILMTSMPPFEPMDPETGVYPTDKYEEYMFHAYTFDEIDADADLTYMLQHQKELIFVYPYDTHYLWMRTFGLTKMVYQHERVDVQQYKWHWDGDNPQWDYDPETGEKVPESYQLYAEPWDRHNLRRGMFLGGQRNLGNTNIAEDTRDLGDFDNRMGPIQGTGKKPRWSMGLQALYFLPVALNINKASEVFYNTDGKSTPFYFKLCITGMGNQKILAGQ